MNRKGFVSVTIVFIGAVVLAALGAGAFLYLRNRQQTTPLPTAVAPSSVPVASATPKTVSPPAPKPMPRAAALSTPPLPVGEIKFNGHTSRGQDYEKEIGGGLFFRLEPSALGWTIAIGSKTSKTLTQNVGYEQYNNFAAVVTPPYRGMNNIDIEGWHFRNSDNTGPNDAGPKNVNAPGDRREFEFVLSDAAYQKAFDALEKTLWPYSYSEKEVADATAAHVGLERGHGALMIRNLKLYNLEAGKQAGIESMDFDAVLNFP